MNTSEVPGPLVGVGVVVRDRRGRILLGERIKAGESPSWCLPGGRLEAGESFETAGLRELEEETGVRAASATAFCLCVHNHTAALWLTAGVLVEVGDDAVPVVTEPHNFASWAWFVLDALPAPLFSATASLLDVFRGTASATIRTVYSLSPSVMAVETSPSPTVQEHM